MNRSSRAAPVSGSFCFQIIELNCLPRRVESRKRPGSRSTSRGSTAPKCARPSDVGKTQPSHSRWPPHWMASPVFVEPLDSLVRGDHAGDLLADLGARVEAHEVGAIRVGPARKIKEDLPFGSRLSDARMRDLRGEGHAALGGGLGSAVALLVAGGSREQEHLLARIDEHLRTSARCPGGRGAARAPAPSERRTGSGSVSRKLPPLDQRTSISPRPAASIISATERPRVGPMGKP